MAFDNCFFATITITTISTLHTLPQIDSILHQFRGIITLRLYYTTRNVVSSQRSKFCNEIFANHLIYIPPLSFRDPLTSLYFVNYYSTAVLTDEQITLFPNLQNALRVIVLKYAMVYFNCLFDHNNQNDI
jgi:hypothetical protein